LDAKLSPGEDEFGCMCDCARFGIGGGGFLFTLPNLSVLAFGVMLPIAPPLLYRPLDDEDDG
jgi:hypothetical protein